MCKRAQYLFKTLLAFALGQPLLSSCYSYDEPVEVNPEFVSEKVASYINLTISVSNGVGQMTRAGEIPAAGENGDGREAGFERENAITGITLMLFKDAAGKGVNGADDLPIQFVEYYPVNRVSRETEGTQYTTKEDEAVYTTGNQLVAKGSIDFSATYYAIVVANANLRGLVSTLGDVRNLKYNYLYNGNEMLSAQNCTQFVMSSEENYTMTFPQPVASSEVGGNLLYNIEQPIRIERLAARIDFWSACSNGYKDTYTTPGYEYDVDATNDKFVVTGITPFNLNSGNTTNGGEFLIKRLADDVSETPNISYLANETGSNYVLDPATTTKTDGTLTYFKNPLTAMGDLSAITSLSTNDYYKSVYAMHTALGTVGNSAGFSSHTEGSLSGENVIIAYPMENTLWSASVLYNYATGIAIEGDYYYDGTGEPEHRIYYGYLRHQGSSASAYSATQGADMSSTETTTSSNCMEFGIVRNNIYRVYISKINYKNGTIKLKIEEEKWRHVDNPVIYI